MNKLFLKLLKKPLNKNFFEKKKKMDDNKSIKSLKEHCAYCFDVILAKLSKEKTPDYPSNLQVFSSPLFVTWHINKDELRGCIG